MPVCTRQLTYALWFFLLLMPGAAAYGETSSWHAAGGAAAPPADVHKKSEIVEIKRIHDAAALLETTVTLEGVFRGWKGRCPSSYMLTKSDWLLEDETGCIYVTGRIPDNVSPVKPQGERMLVTGRVLTDKKGRSIIKADQIRQLPQR